MLTDWNGKWEGDTYVFPPTAEERIAIEDHIRWITDSKTKRTKRFKLLMERYMEEWHKSVMAKSYPLNVPHHTWHPRMQDVMNIVVKEYKENAKR